MPGLAVLGVGIALSRAAISTRSAEGGFGAAVHHAIRESELDVQEEHDEEDQPDHGEGK